MCDCAGGVADGVHALQGVFVVVVVCDVAGGGEDVIDAGAVGVEDGGVVGGVVFHGQIVAYVGVGGAGVVYGAGDTAAGDVVGEGDGGAVRQVHAHEAVFGVECVDGDVGGVGFFGLCAQVAIQVPGVFIGIILK